MRDEEARELDALAARFELSATELAVAGRPVRLVHPRDAEALIDEAAFAADERLPYWADLWPSAIVLAAHVAAMSGAGRTLLELGCGTGLVSTAAARAGFAVTATDYYDDALRFAALNARANAGVAIATRMVDWRALPDDLGTYDVVVASDVLYERPYAALVAGALARALAPGGEGWLADPGRIATPAFIDEAARRGLRATLDRELPFEEPARRQRIAIYRIVRAA